MPQFHFQYFLRFLIPGAIYMINNNLMFWALEYISPPLFVLLGNLKVLFTALAMKMILKRHFTQKAYFALFLLFTGICLTQVKPGEEYSVENLVGLGIPVLMVRMYI